MRVRNVGMVALLCAALAGCPPAGNDAPPADESPSATPAAPDAAAHDVAQLTVQPRSVSAGGNATITLTNHSEQALGYNLCPASLERRTNGQWEERPERPAEVCTMELRRLEPHQSADYRHTIPAGLPTGTYRFRVAISHPFDGDQVVIRSEEFEVEGR